MYEMATILSLEKYALGSNLGMLFPMLALLNIADVGVA
jgi:hypothetical protein